MKARLLRDMTCQPTEKSPSKWECSTCPAGGRGAKQPACPECGAPVRQGPGIKPKGTVLQSEPTDTLGVWHLVRQGVAEPVDEECRRRANRTPEQIARAAAAYEKVSRGIHPEDYDAFDRGEMTGYDASGEPIPGPAFTGEDDDELGEPDFGEE